MRPNPQESADLVTFNEEILNEKLHFLCNKKNKLNEDYLLLFLFSFKITRISKNSI